MTTIEERLNGATATPWIPDPAKAEKYDKDSCDLNPLIGTAVDHYRRTNFMGDGEYDVIVLNVPEVGDVAVHCQPTVLASQMHSARPRPGEKVGVKWLGEVKGGQRSYTNYKVVVEREPGGSFNWTDGEQAPAFETKAPEPVTVPSTADEDIPFAWVDNTSIEAEERGCSYRQTSSLYL